MPRTLSSPRHDALRDLLIESRTKAGLTQHQLAAALGRSQSYVASIERGQRRVDVVELLELGEVMKFDAAAMMRKLSKLPIH
jgi:transcriptional regulator with XRE-family HTH domain